MIMRILSGAVAVLAVTLTACGSSSPSAPTVTTPPVPAASITATGSGAVVLHPSAVPAFLVALQTPIRISETSGGSASWDFARMSILNNGVEVERAEIGASTISAAGFSNIGANTNAVYSPVFHFNAQTFNAINITLGFTDKRNGSQFTVAVPFGSFSGVQQNLSPLAVVHASDPL
jgi:hypothetical protein